MSTNITGCNFVGVQFDEAAIDVIDKIADGLIYNSQAIIENAKASKELVGMLRANNIHIEAMVKVEQPPLPLVVQEEVAPTRKSKKGK